MSSLDRALDVPDILNEWDPDTPWRIVKDTDGSLVFLYDSQGRLMPDLEVIKTFLHGVINWSGLGERITEAGVVNIKQLFKALYVLAVHASSDAEEEDR